MHRSNPKPDRRRPDPFASPYFLGRPRSVWLAAIERRRRQSASAS
jgi:hypothetical protein